MKTANTHCAFFGLGMVLYWWGEWAQIWIWICSRPDRKSSKIIVLRRLVVLRVAQIRNPAREGPGHRIGLCASLWVGRGGRVGRGWALGVEAARLVRKIQAPRDTQQASKGHPSDTQETPQPSA